MSKIHLLEKNVYELIAAGEVVERPASIVKELIENAIDANACHVEITIKHGGKTLIRVIDDGNGMSAKDCQKAFLRHATSKVTSEMDLEHIATLGFRGEALASICAVSKVEALTRSAEQELGTRYQINGGEEISLEPAGCPLGTSVSISDIFYNVPARMKFLKKDATEANAIHDIVDKLALSHPDISFVFRKENKLALQTPGNGRVEDAVYTVFGKSFFDTLMPVTYKDEICQVSGLVSQPMQSRKKRSMQYFFINGRYIQSKTCSVALEEAFKNSIMIGNYPACVLYVTIPPNQLDINVHPSKIEVRFSDERAVLKAVYTAVKQSITNYQELPPVKEPKQHIEKKCFSSKEESVQTIEDVKAHLNKGKFTFASAKVEIPKESPNLFKNHPLLSSSNVSFGTRSMSSVTHSKTNTNLKTPRKTVLQTEEKDNTNLSKDTCFLQSLANQSAKNISQSQDERQTNAQSFAAKEKKTQIRMIGELFQTYILAEIGDCLVIVDKHAAHERILYEQLKEQRGHMERQLLLQPVSMTFSRKQYELILDSSELLYRFGFGVEDFGNCTVLIREIPAVLKNTDFKQILEELIQNLSDGKQDISPRAVDRIYQTIACRSAIKGHDNNSPQELRVLFERVYFDDTIRTCPHGRPVVLTYSKERFEKQFGRIQK